MNLLDRWADRRNRQWIERWEQEHRWDRLGKYNAERARGIVHTPEWSALMAREQEEFDRQMGYSRTARPDGFPITLDPS